MESEKGAGGQRGGGGGARAATGQPCAQLLLAVNEDLLKIRGTLKRNIPTSVSSADFKICGVFTFKSSIF